MLGARLRSDPVRFSQILEFTKSYLPDSSLQISPEKIRVAPMPLLAGACRF